MSQHCLCAVLPPAAGTPMALLQGFIKVLRKWLGLGSLQNTCELIVSGSRLSGEVWVEVTDPLPACFSVKPLLNVRTASGLSMFNIPNENIPSNAKSMKIQTPERWSPLRCPLPLWPKRRLFVLEPLNLLRDRKLYPGNHAQRHDKEKHCTDLENNWNNQSFVALGWGANTVRAQASSCCNLPGEAMWRTHHIVYLLGPLGTNAFLMCHLSVLWGARRPNQAELIWTERVSF